MGANELTKPSATSLVLRRTFDAPVERVFAAWLSPDAVRAFMVGDAKAVLDASVDARVGGAYHLTWDTDDGPMTVRGVYREIVENRRIVCTWVFDEDDPADVVESLLTLEFAPRGEGTELVLTHTNLRHEESRDGHATGWQSIFDKLAAFIASD